MVKRIIISLVFVVWLLCQTTFTHAQTNAVETQLAETDEIVETISSKDFDAAFRKLKAQDQLQFDLAEAQPPPKLGWLEKIMKPIMAFLGAMLPVFKLLFWGFVIGGIALILYIIATAVLNFRRARLERAAQEDEAPVLYRPSHMQARVLLAAVDALAAEGRYGEAVHQLLFRSIQDIGLSRPNMIRRSYTSREIAVLKELSPETRKAFSFITAEVEKSHFGGRKLDKEAFLRCREAYAQFAVPERSEENLSVSGGLTA